MNFRSNDNFSEKAFGHMNFRSNDPSVKRPFFEKCFRSNELSVICHFGHLTSFLSYIFGQMTIFQIFSAKQPFDKFVFGQMTRFGKMKFRSNGLQFNGDSVK
jgi:hypothetical protein